MVKTNMLIIYGIVALLLFNANGSIYGGDNSCPDSTEPFETIQEAEVRASEVGCSGTHYHSELGSNGMYMACENHNAAVLEGC